MGMSSTLDWTQGKEKEGMAGIELDRQAEVLLCRPFNVCMCVCVCVCGGGGGGGGGVGDWIAAGSRLPPITPTDLTAR